MHFNVLNRKVHYWASFIIALPLGVMIVTGVLLQMKKQWTWVQPAEQRGSGKVPTLTLNEILERVKTVPEMNVKGWEDVNRLDVRPSRGMVKVWLMNNWEVQVDLETGKILQTAYRRSDWIESIHDGSVFAGDWTKLGLFLPTGLTLFGLYLTGLWMWWIPYSRKRGVRRRRAAAVSGRSALPAAAGAGRVVKEGR
jgi:uncharacterized iron-regulated membrane protein